MRKRIISMLLAVTMLACAVMPVSAVFSNTGKTFKNKEGGFLGIGATTYTYRVFKDSASWYTMMHSKDVCPAIRHTKNTGPKSLTYARSQSYSSQTAYDFSVSCGMTAGSDLVKGTVSATGGMSQSYSYSIAASGTVGSEIPKESASGWYKLTLCYNFTKYRLDKYNERNSGSCMASYYVALPKGRCYIATLYSKDGSTSNYAIW